MSDHQINPLTIQTGNDSVQHPVSVPAFEKGSFVVSDDLSPVQPLPPVEQVTTPMPTPAPDQTQSSAEGDASSED